MPRPFLAQNSGVFGVPQKPPIFTYFWVIFHDFKKYENHAIFEFLHNWSISQKLKKLVVTQILLILKKSRFLCATQF